MSGRKNPGPEPKASSSDEAEIKQTAETSQTARGNPKLTKADVDLFWLEKVFTKPEDVFSYKRPPMDQVVATCVFALDTNVLLAPYLIGKDSLQEITGIYTRLHRDNRLFTAAQAVREYGKNRARKIADVYTAIHQRASKVPNIQKLDTPMLEGVDEYEKLKDIEDEIQKKANEYSKGLTALKGRLTNWGWDDRVSDLYRQVFSTTNIIHSDISEDALRADLTRRNIYKIPPGYKDQGKDDDGVGDLIIWNALLRIGRDVNRDVAFVCNEEKPDWFVRSSEDVLMPRPELTHEFHEKTGHHLIIINWAYFLEVMQANPGTVQEAQKAQEEPVDEVRPAVQRVMMHLQAIARRTSEFSGGYRAGVSVPNTKIRPYIRHNDFDQHIRGAIREARDIIDKHTFNAISHLLKQMVTILMNLSEQNSSIKRICSAGTKLSAIEIRRMLALCGQFETLHQRLLGYQFL